MRKFSITTLGCKVNQYESDAMAQVLNVAMGRRDFLKHSGAGAAAAGLAGSLSIQRSAHAAGDRQAAASQYARLLPLINYENRQCGWRACKTVMKVSTFPTD